MKELFDKTMLKATNVRLTREQIQVLIILIVVLLLVVGGGAPSEFSGWGGT
ncbi:MAG: hypothetical protein ACOC8X_02930 [Chloroflexota bacterium]